MKQTITHKLSDKAHLFPTLMRGYDHLLSACLPIDKRDEFMIRNEYVIPEGTPIIEIVNKSEDGMLKQIIVYKGSE